MNCKLKIMKMKLGMAEILHSSHSTRNSQFRPGFTLIEMLVVIGIIAILLGVAISSFTSITRRAARMHAVELVSNVSTALNVLFQQKNRWPQSLADNASGGNGQLNARAAASLAVNRLMALTYTEREEDGQTVRVLSGLDRCGIVTPWAAKVIKRLGQGADPLSAKVPPSDRTVRQHILHYALDLDGDGITEANVGGETIRIRTNAAVWCIDASGGNEGEPWPYSVGKSKGTDIYSWTERQVEER